MKPDSKFDIKNLTIVEEIIFRALPSQKDNNGGFLRVSFSDILKQIKLDYEHIPFEEITDALNRLKEKGWIKETSYYQSNVQYIKGKGWNHI